MLAASQLPEKKLTLNFVKSQHRLEETRDKVRGTTGIKSAKDEGLLTAKVKSTVCFRCGKDGHFAVDCKASTDDVKRYKKKMVTTGKSSESGSLAISF